MPVGLGPLPTLYPVSGFRLGTACAGIKKAAHKDVVVMQVVEGATIAGVYTTNAFCAAPVKLCQQHMGNAPRYLLVNTGNANAGTGQPGMQAALDSCAALAQLAEVNTEQILPFSTGVIGELLPVDKIVAVLPQALDNLSEENWAGAASGIMTTDTLPKGASRQINLGGETITITGISKGAGMIRPNMATMLGFVATDAKVAQPVLQRMLKEAADLSFNRITIDGDTSTNDSCMLIATGQAAMDEIVDVASVEYVQLAAAVNAIMLELAQAIVRDGEGATKFVTIEVNGGGNRDECLDVAYAVAHSPLIKTALFASDPNWGRILAAVGYAGVPNLNVEQIDVYLGDICIARHGARADDYTEEQGARVMAQAEITIRIELNRGVVSETLWTTDLSHEYVRINAEYRT